MHKEEAEERLPEGAPHRFKLEVATMQTALF